MRTLLLVSAFAGLATSAAVAGENAAVDAQNCRSSMDQWVRHEAADGAKILETHFRAGAIGVFTVRWDNGAEQLVTVMPATGDDGRPAVCLVARETLKGGRQAILGAGFRRRE